MGPKAARPPENNAPFLVGHLPGIGHAVALRGTNSSIEWCPHVPRSCRVPVFKALGLCQSLLLRFCKDTLKVLVRQPLDGRDPRPGTPRPRQFLEARAASPNACASIGARWRPESLRSLSCTARSFTERHKGYCYAETASDFIGRRHPAQSGENAGYGNFLQLW